VGVAVAHLHVAVQVGPLPVGEDAPDPVAVRVHATHPHLLVARRARGPAPDAPAPEARDLDVLDAHAAQRVARALPGVEEHAAAPVGLGAVARDLEVRERDATRVGTKTPVPAPARIVARPGP